MRTDLLEINFVFIKRRLLGYLTHINPFSYFVNNTKVDINIVLI